jgi:hypothetical protein
VVKALDYKATDDLKLKWNPPDDASPGSYYLLTTPHRKTTRWSVEDYFTQRPGEIAKTVMRDYARAKGTPAKPIAKDARRAPLFRRKSE